MGLIKAIRSKFVYRLVFYAALLELAYLVVMMGSFLIMFGGSLMKSSPTQVALLIVLSFVVFAGWVVAFYFVGRSFMRPLNFVVDSVRAACQGEIGHKVDVKTEDEFGVLARSYNQMLDLIGPPPPMAAASRSMGLAASACAAM